MHARSNMDCGDPPAFGGIAFSCPHCGNREIDDLELLPADEVHAMTCGACGNRYHLAIEECSGCGEEAVFTWKAVPTPRQIRGARCTRCGKAMYDDDDEVRTMGREP